MNELQIFKNEEFGEIRTVEIEGKPYFVANDVAQCLGYAVPKDAVTRHCKGALKHRHLTEGGKQEVKIIPEGDIYRLVIRSKLPTAEKFESWVFDEVLPAIRKHGMYAVDQLLDNPDLAIQAFTALKEEREKNKHLQGEIAQKDQVIAELNPKASYYDVVLQTKDTISTSQIAKDYGKSAVWLNTYLHDKGIQYKQGKTWLLYQRYAEQGYTKSKTHTYSGNDGLQHSNLHTYWTQKGRLFIYDLLKADGILPVMEQIQNGNEAG